MTKKELIAWAESHRLQEFVVAVPNYTDYDDLSIHSNAMLASRPVKPRKSYWNGEEEIFDLTEQEEMLGQLPDIIQAILEYVK